MSDVKSFLPLLVAVALAAGFAIAGEWTGDRRLHRRYKPIATLLLVAAGAMGAVQGGGRYAVAVAIGLALSLAGDVFLMLESDRFREGLAAFLLAHVAYLVAFTTGTPLFPVSLPLFVWAVIGSGTLGVLWGGIPKALRIPVAVYVLALLAMAAQANGRAAFVRTLPAVLASGGGTLFVFSDAALAIERFRRPSRLLRCVVLGLYWMAQSLIALSVLVKTA